MSDSLKADVELLVCDECGLGFGWINSIYLGEVFCSEECAEKWEKEHEDD